MQNQEIEPATSRIEVNPVWKKQKTNMQSSKLNPRIVINPAKHSTVQKLGNETRSGTESETGTRGSGNMNKG